MFVNSKRNKVKKGLKPSQTIRVLASASVITCVSAMTCVAADAPAWKQKTGEIPIMVTLMDVIPEGETGGPIYVSIQTRDNYRSMKGFGGVIAKAEAGRMTATYQVDEPGEYSVSVWHDRDDDGRFSMTDTYEVLDSWGASGTPPQNASPTFDDVKVNVPNIGIDVTINMINPNS